MKENFVMEMARGINEPGQQRIDKFLKLIKEANRLQKEFIEALTKLFKSEKELSVSHEIFELVISDKEVLVTEPYVEADGSLAESMFELVPDGCIDALKNVKEIRISAFAGCPEENLPRKLVRILCPKYERGLYKEGIKNYHKCTDNCIYCSGDFNSDGWNGEGYEIDKIQLRQFGIKI